MPNLLLVVLNSLTLFLLCGCSPSQQDQYPATPVDPGSRRIISFAPAITEMLFALELGDRVVGVSSFCRFPPEVLSLPKAGGLLDPNLEAIVRLQPDCVILYPNHAAVLEMLTRLKIPALTAKGDNLPEIRKTILLLGETFHRQQKAQKLVHQMDRRLTALRESLPPDHRTASVLVVVWRERGQGTLKNLTVAGNDQYFSEMIAAAGGKLLPEHSSLDYPSLGLESVLQLDPEIIIEIAPELAGGNAEMQARAIADWEILPGLKARQKKQIHLICDDFAAIPGPRCMQLAEKIAVILAPVVSKQLPPESKPASPSHEPPPGN